MNILSVRQLWFLQFWRRNMRTIQRLACVKPGVGKPIWDYKKLANFDAFLALGPLVLAAKPVAPVEKQSEHSSWVELLSMLQLAAVSVATGVATVLSACFLLHAEAPTLAGRVWSLPEISLIYVLGAIFNPSWHYFFCCYILCCCVGASSKRACRNDVMLSV